jgi:uncharacterized protein
MEIIEKIFFKPLLGTASPHLQTILACLTLPGIEPPSSPLKITLSDGDQLCCEMSTPLDWQATQKTVVLIHGLGGSHKSNYVVRTARKLFEYGYKVVRINLRGCGSGKGLAKRPYHGGTTEDVLAVLQRLKQENSSSPIILIGFSLGGNIVLKLGAELGKGQQLIEKSIAICPPIDIEETVRLLMRPSNYLYHRYYVKKLRREAKPWIQRRKFSSIPEFDNLVTAPNWGFNDAWDYYAKSSSRFVLSEIEHPCDILFAADDPFINYQSAFDRPLAPQVKIWATQRGGHLGFLGTDGKNRGCFWIDQLIEKWVCH